MFGNRKLAVFIWWKSFLPIFFYLLQMGTIYGGLSVTFRAFSDVNELYESILEMKKLTSDEKKLTEKKEIVENSLDRLNWIIFGTTVVEIGVLVYFLWSVKSGIAERLGQIANDLNLFSAEIAQTMELQEQNTAQQAAAVNQTTTTMDELSASSQQSAEQASAAAIDAGQGLGLAESGLTAVENTESVMSVLSLKVNDMQAQIGNLTEKTNQIGNISKLVTDLANQTNMLALNAAVEAVRAGEHGKGFAVVAQEIRKLADQSKASTASIDNLVADIQMAIDSTVMVTQEGRQTVEKGVKIAQDTAKTFRGLTEAIDNISLSVQQISLNAKQQALAIQQVVDTMSNINYTASQTATSISQVKRGSEKLNHMIQSLQKMV
jgi:methyl-accepting chemotaxis protein